MTQVAFEKGSRGKLSVEWGVDFGDGWACTMSPLHNGKRATLRRV